MTEETLDTIIRNVDIVSGGGVVRGDIGIRAGKIVPPIGEARETIDGTGLTALPGLLDTHVHIRAPGISHRETFYTGTCAAAAGGITTIFEMPVSKPATSSVKLLMERVEAMEREAVVDVAFYGAAGYDNLEDIGPLAEAGVIGFKTFSQRAVPGREEEFRGLTAPDSGALYRVCEEVAKTGKILAIHAESDPLIDLIQRDGRYQNYAAAPYYARPPIVELDAIARSIVIAGDTGARISLCHTSTPAAVELIRRMRRPDQEVYIESCVHYFEGSLDDALRLGPWGKLKPPLRAAEGLPAMRRHFAQGHIDMLGSDHAPFTREEKLAEKTPDGLAAMELTLPMLLCRVRTGELTLEQIAAYASERPAKIFGLYPRKGTLQAGADADVVLVDLQHPYTVQVENLLTQAKDCARLYQGRTTGGTVVKTLVCGRTVYDRGRITAEPGWGSRICPGREIPIGP